MKMVKKLLLLKTILLFLFFIGMAHAIGDPSLVALWTFDEGSGNVLKDVTGNGNDGKFIGNPEWVLGKYGTTLEFNGTSDYVEVPDSDELNITQNLTWATWFKPSITIDPSNASAYRLMSKNNAYFFLFNYEQIGNLGFLIKDGGTNYFVHSQTNEWKKEEWYHVVGTYDGKVLKIYINGKLEGEKEHKGSIDASPLTMWIGADDLPHYFPGAIDETQVYNRTLSDAEVKNLMNSSAAVEPHAKLTTSWGRIKGCALTNCNAL
jgi:hypothetical protein